MGFLEATEIKDSASEPTDLKDKEGVVRRTSRSLQARPASMPVDKYLLVGLPCPEDETAQDAKGKESTSGKMLPKSLLKGLVLRSLHKEFYSTQKFELLGKIMHA